MACGDDAHSSREAPLLARDGSQPDQGAPDAGSARRAIYPIDFEQTYLEMRDCRHSHEHELRYIRVFASPSAQKSYGALSASEPYPVGAQIVKIEYDDSECAQPVGFTAMEKLSVGANPDGSDWFWQSVDADGQVRSEGAPPRCVQCHEHHCEPPFGYDLTCAEEL